MGKFGQDLIKAAEEALSIARGEADPSTYRVHRFEEVDVRAIRKRLKLTQAAFARRFGLDVAAIRDWEQGRRRPEQAARVLLKVIDQAPEVVERVLHPAA